MAIEILDSGSVKALALITFAEEDALPTVIGKGVRSFTGNGAAVDLVLVDPIPPNAVVLFGPVRTEAAATLTVELDPTEGPDDPGEIELEQVGFDGDPLAAEEQWALMVIFPPGDMGEVPGTLF